MSSDERMRILRLIESGQISAEEGDRLINALDTAGSRARTRTDTPRLLRVRVTDLDSKRRKVNVTIPVSLINTAIELGARLTPNNETSIIEQVMHAIARGTTGRVVDLHDLEASEQIEIFVE